MFYVKTKIGEGTCITTEITDDNVFTTCASCGRELQVDLDEAIIDGHLDLFGLSIRCEKCSYKHALQHPGEGWAKALIADQRARRGTQPPRENPFSRGKQTDGL